MGKERTTQCVDGPAATTSQNRRKINTQKGEKKSLDVEKVISHLVTYLCRTIPRTQLNILLSNFNDDLVKLKSRTKKMMKRHLGGQRCCHQDVMISEMALIKLSG